MWGIEAFVQLLQTVYFQNTVAVKLLKGTVECPQNPSDAVYDAFTGDPSDMEALLAANSISMKQTYVGKSHMEFCVPEELHPWVAEHGVASICMVQEGMRDASTACWESGICTKRLGYMRWTGERSLLIISYAPVLLDVAQGVYRRLISRIVSEVPSSLASLMLTCLSVHLTMGISCRPLRHPVRCVNGLTIESQCRGVCALLIGFFGLRIVLRRPYQVL